MVTTILYFGAMPSLKSNYIIRQLFHQAWKHLLQVMLSKFKVDIENRAQTSRSLSVFVSCSIINWEPQCAPSIFFKCNISKAIIATSVQFMRVRLKPPDGMQTICAKGPVFDLQTRKTYKGLFLRSHGQSPQAFLKISFILESPPKNYDWELMRKCTSRFTEMSLRQSLRRRNPNQLRRFCSRPPPGPLTPSASRQIIPIAFLIKQRWLQPLKKLLFWKASSAWEGNNRIWSTYRHYFEIILQYS